MKIELKEEGIEGRRAFTIWKDNNPVNNSTVYPDETNRIDAAVWLITIAKRLEAGMSDRMAVIHPGDENQ